MFLFQIRLYIYTRPILNRKPNKNEPFADRPRLILGKCWTKYGMIFLLKGPFAMGMLDTNVAIFRQFDTTETYNWYNKITRAPVCGRFVFCMNFFPFPNGAVAEKFPTNHSLRFLRDIDPGVIRHSLSLRGELWDQRCGDLPIMDGFITLISLNYMGITAKLPRIWLMSLQDWMSWLILIL